jgi:hypothetical protein
VLDGDLVAEESCRPGTGVGDQRLVRRQFQLEVLTQERRKPLFDLLGFVPGSGEPEQMIVRLCRPPGYVERGPVFLAVVVARAGGVGISRVMIG